jgi:hypothetical protein
MKIVLFAMSEHVLVDKIFNDASLINLLDEVSGATFPMFMPLAQFMAVIDREEGEPQTPSASIRILLDQTVLFDQPVSVDFADQSRTRCIGTIRGLTIPAAGTLSSTFSLDGLDPVTWETKVQALNPATLEAATGA